MLLFKLDDRMPIPIVIYILNYIDRNNPAAAPLRGFEEDLGRTGNQFSTIPSTFYVGYATMHAPTNRSLSHIGKPSICLHVCMAHWGLISILTGVTHDLVGALLTRFLGICECAFLPGALFLLSKWCKCSELGLRATVLACGSLLNNAFNLLTAYGIFDGMEGVMEYSAWRWLFYIGGSLTISTALVAGFVLLNFLSAFHRWLSPVEVRLADKRMEEDAGVGDEGQTEVKSEWQIFVGALTDWKVIYMTSNLTCIIIPLSFNALFPTLTATLWYNSTVTLLLCAPSWLFATLVAFAVTRHSDATGERSFYVVASLSVGLVGSVIASSTVNITT